MKLFNKIAALAIGAFMALGVGISLASIDSKPVSAAGEGSATLVISTGSTNYSAGFLVPDAEASATEANWTATQFAVKWLKNAASSNIAYTYAEIRAYTAHSLAFTPASGYQITSIVANTAGSSYPAALSGASWTNASTSVSGSVVTITPVTTGSVCSAVMGAQSRINTLVINYAIASLDPVINIDKTTLSFETGGETQTITASYANLSGTLTWSSLDTSVCTVANGVVTPVGVGETTVRAYDSDDPDLQANCSVTVVAGSVTALDINIGYSEANTTRFTAYASTVADQVIYSTANLGNAGLYWTATVTPYSGSKASISNNNYEANGSSQFGKSGGFNVSTVVIRSDYFSLVSGNAISRIDLKAGGAAGTSTGSVSVSVGGTSMTCETANTFTGSTTNDFKFTSATPLLGRIVITLTNNAGVGVSSSGMKLVQVLIKDVTKDTSDNGQAMDFIAALENCDSCAESAASILTAYNNLSSSVKAIVDGMSVLDYATTDTARVGAKIATFNVGQKLVQLSLLSGGSGSTNFSFADSNSKYFIIIFVGLGGFTTIAAFYFLRKKKATE